MPKTRDLGVNVISQTMRPSEIDRCTAGTLTTCLPGTLMNASEATVLTDEDIRLLRQQLHQ